MTSGQPLRNCTFPPAHLKTALSNLRLLAAASVLGRNPTLAGSLGVCSMGSQFSGNDQYLDVDPPATKGESCLTHNPKRWARTLIRTEHSRYPSLIQLTAIQPHPLHTRRPLLLSSSRCFSLPMQNTREEREVSSRTTLHPHPPAHSHLQRWLKNSPFPNPTSPPSRLSYTPESSCRRPPRSSISAVCVSQTDGQLPLLAVFSWDFGTSTTLGLVGWK